MKAGTQANRHDGSSNFGYAGRSKAHQMSEPHHAPEEHEEAYTPAEPQALGTYICPHNLCLVPWIKHTHTHTHAHLQSKQSRPRAASPAGSARVPCSGAGVSGVHGRCHPGPPCSLVQLHELQQGRPRTALALRTHARAHKRICVYA
eukprot:scaffold309657_cov23-Tisochrysis_lutea.AAC.1